VSNFNESSATVFRERLKKNWPIWLVAFATFVNGVVSVLQIMLTRLPIKPSHFRTLLPFGQYYINRSLTLVLGFMLLYLSIHLLQHRRIAWWVATVCAGLAFVLHIAHLHLWYTAISPATAFILLLVFRKRFTVRPESRSLLQGFGLLVFSILFALMYGAVGFWLLDIRDFGVHITFIDALVRTFREFTLIGNNDLVAQTRYAVWFIQSLRILGVVTGGFAFYSLFRPVVYHIETLPHNREKAHVLLMKHGRATYDYFKVWADKNYFFSASGNTFIAYRTIASVALALGDPVGPDDELESTIVSFSQFCMDNGWSACFLVPELIPMYQRLDFAILKIGEEASVDLEHFRAHTANKKYFRYIRRKLEGEGYHAIRYKPPHPASLLSEIGEVSKEWLKMPKHREFGFFQGHFDYRYLASTPLFVVRNAEGHIVAFVNEVPSYLKGEANFDMMRHLPGLHWGIMDYLFMELMLTVQKEGYSSFNIGLAPLAGVGESAEATLLEKALHQLYEHFDWFVSAKGMRQFKIKFEPKWQNRYMVYQGGAAGLTKAAIAISRAL
jgi:phosphatidylglycerol lysyltransferase